MGKKAKVVKTQNIENPDQLKVKQYLQILMIYIVTW